MKEFRLVDKLKLDLQENTQPLLEDSVKIKITKAAITHKDILYYSGEISEVGFVPLENAVGVVSECNNSTNFNKADRVFIDKYMPCKNCNNCKIDCKKYCVNMKCMGYNTDGFLTDFKIVPESNVFPLPDNVSDEQALFIPTISIAIEILNRIEIDKGEHIVIFGSNILSNILAQIALYYQAVPILVDNNEKNIEIAKRRGIYYTITNASETPQLIKEITGGRLAENVIYCATSNFSAENIFKTCSAGSKCAITELQQTKDCKLNLQEAFFKQVKLDFVSNGYGNISTAINLLANKAVCVDSFISTQYSFNEAPLAFEQTKSKTLNARNIEISVINC